MKMKAFSQPGPCSAWLMAAILPAGMALAQEPGTCPGPLAVPDAAVASPLAAPVRLGQPAADIQGVDATGARINLARFKGQVILLDVSTMWCVFCQEDTAPIQALYRTYGPKGLAVVTCLTEDVNGAAVTLAGLRQWTGTYHLTLPVMNDASGVADGVAETAYVGVTDAFPTLVLIDRDFKVRYIQGGLDLDEVTARIKALLAG